MPDIHSHYAPTFNAGFWQPYAPVAGTPNAAEPASATGAPRLSYSAQVHGSHADFQRSEDFTQYKNQVRANLSFLTDFCRQHQMWDADSIEADFDVFFRHRFDEYHYFDAHAEIVDSTGKRSLDEFCSMIGNEAIDLEKRKTAIRNLSQGMTAHADSVISNLACAAGVLAKATGGLRGKLWELKEETANQVLLQAMCERFGRDWNYQSNEIYYVQTAWNLLADRFGLEKRPSDIQAPGVLRDSAFMSTCAAQVDAALTPDRLSYLVAEECQARFNSQISTGSGESFRILDTDTENKVRRTLNETAESLGLATEDQLRFDEDKRDWILRQSDLRLKSFLKLEENYLAFALTDPPRAFVPARDPDAATTYRLRVDPSLIALDILRAMSDLNLLAPESQPQSHGEWVEKDGRRAAIFTYGGLAWAARIPPNTSFQEPVWAGENVEFDLVILPDVLQWKATQGDDGQPAPVAAIRQAIRATDVGELEKTRARWLEDIEGIWQLLGGLGPDEARDYLVRSLTALGTGYTDEQRTDLLARVARMGLGDAVEPLTRQWLSNSPSLSA